ncbi:dynein axonemal heavy chain 9-like isoform X2 [Artemia franciscana]|uniref:dynein axonemal heavy chain 9-like isoform X2 n=1 Tax=Artemia franciscana TaxID=6661 RepID=UPI0032D9E47B
MAAIELDVDERIDFIGEICMKVFSVNEEVWTRFSSLHEHHRKFAEFLDSSDEPRQLIITLIDFQLQASNKPISMEVLEDTEKALYFLKIDPEPVSNRNVRDAFVFGTLTKDILSHIVSFVSYDVLVSMVKCEEIGPCWSSAVKDEIIQVSEEAAVESNRIEKRSKGQTVLSARQNPFPENLSGPAQVAEAEALALMWEHLLKSLAPTWGCALHKEEYWKNRCADLENIYEQLLSQTSKKASNLLEESGSIHVGTMKKLIAATVAALAEGKTILQYIGGVHARFEKVLSLDVNAGFFNNMSNAIKHFAEALDEARTNSSAFQKGIFSQKLLRYYTISTLDKISSYFSFLLFSIDEKSLEECIKKTKLVVEEFRVAMICNSNVSDVTQLDDELPKKEDSISIVDQQYSKMLLTLFECFQWKLSSIEELPNLFKAKTFRDYSCFIQQDVIMPKQMVIFDFFFFQFYRRAK